VKLFKGHAVLPRRGHEHTYVVRTYVVIARTWQHARVLIQDAEPRAEFVTVPGEVPDVLMTGVASVNERELEDLRSACAWNENASIRASEERAGKLIEIHRSKRTR
jgi:hypothetical protein